MCFRHKSTLAQLGIVLSLAGLAFVSGCDNRASTSLTRLAHEDLDAAAWVHTSAEYQAITTSLYRVAREKLMLALADQDWSALPTQQDQFQNGTNGSALPPAVILDVDETVLNNVAFQARMIQNETEYNTERWNRWVDEASAPFVAGAAEFIELCEAHDVRIFYVTNRRADIERETRRNLERLGAIGPDDEDRILSKYERDGWTTDKSTRRTHVAKHFRILLLIGDDLNDFLWVGDKPTAEERRAQASAYEQWWGHKWFLLPNPNYGGWERALHGFDDQVSRATKLAQKRSSLPGPPTNQAP